MKFLLNKKEKNKKETVIVIDMGSDSVGAAIVSLPSASDKYPEIINYNREQINFFKNKITLKAFTNDTLKALKKALRNLKGKNKIKPKQIFCVLSAPWYSLESRRIKIKKEASFVFNKKLFTDLVHKEIDRVVESNSKKSRDIEIIDNHILDILLNGYKVEALFNVKTKSVDMSMVTILSQKTFLDKIRKILLHDYHKISISFSSFILSSYFTVRDKYISPDSYLLLDIGGEITEVGIVSKGIFKSSLSFPFGKKTFYKYISTKLEIDERDAMELFHLFTTGNLEEKKRKEVSSLFKSVELSWSEAFKESIKSLPYILALPSTIFLSADQETIDYFAEVIKKEEFIQAMTIEHKYSVIPLKKTQFLDLCKVAKGVPYDSFLMIEVISLVKKLVNK